MMDFIQHYSSSHGNLYEARGFGGQRLLIECGMPWNKIQKALNYELTNIKGCLLSHEHADHSKAIEDVLVAGIDVFASEGTLRAVEESLHLHRRAHVIRDRERFTVGPFGVFPFAVRHDAAEALGFIIHTDDENLLFVTDTSHITQRFGCAFDIIAICCGYDAQTVSERVKDGTINETFAKRLLTSHMERHITRKYLTECCDLSRCREIHLLHLSGENIDNAKVAKEIEEVTFVKTIVAGRDTRAGRQ